MQGIWKLSVSLRAGANSKLLPPRRLRFLAPAQVEVPYSPDFHGDWKLRGPDPGSLAQRASFKLYSTGTPGVQLSFDGLFDGERIAGSFRHGCGEDLGDFLCTRLFTFWGEPSLAAGVQ